MTDTDEPDPPEQVPAAPGVRRRPATEAQLEQQRNEALAATQARIKALTPEQKAAALERWGDRNAPATPRSIGKALSDTLLNGRAELHRRIMAHPTSKETLEFLRARRESLKGGPTK